MALAQSGKARFSMFLMNPMVRKLDKVEERSTVHSTYGGIVQKTLFLLLLTVLGGVIFFMTNSIVPTSYNYVIEGYTVNMLEGAIVIASMLFTLIAPFIAFKFVRTSMLLGCIYSLAQGYTLGFICGVVGNDYLYPMALAFGLTVIIVAVMLIIYRMHIIRIDRKFMSVVATLFFTSIVCSVLLGIAAFIPQTRFIFDLLQENSIIAIGAGVLGVIFVCLFLLVDFEVIHHCVEDELPKTYEWLAAFALSFSIIDLYIKILNLILRITQNNKK